MQGHSLSVMCILLQLLCKFRFNLNNLIFPDIFDYFFKGMNLKQFYYLYSLVLLQNFQGDGETRGLFAEFL